MYISCLRPANVYSAFILYVIDLTFGTAKGKILLSLMSNNLTLPWQYISFFPLSLPLSLSLSLSLPLSLSLSISLPPSLSLSLYLPLPPSLPPLPPPPSLSLSLSQSLDDTPHHALLKELFTSVFSTPYYHPKSKPFTDHVFHFGFLDDHIWFRNYQVGINYVHIRVVLVCMSNPISYNMYVSLCFITLLDWL